MPRRSVVELKCDRCPRVWYEDAPGTTSGLELVFKPPEGEVTTLVYEVLCSSCTKTVNNYVKGIAKVRNKEGDTEDVPPTVP